MTKKQKKKIPKGIKIYCTSCGRTSRVDGVSKCKYCGSYSTRLQKS